MNTLQKNCKKSLGNKMYTTIVVMLPILSVYASGIPGFTLGDITLAGAFLIFLLDVLNQKKIFVAKTTRPLFSLILAIIVLSMISLFLQGVLIYNEKVSASSGDILIRIVRRVFYYGMVPLVSSKWFNYNQAKSQIKVLGILATVTILAQYVLYYVFHYVLKGFLPFLLVYHDNYMTNDYVSLYGKMFRPTGYLLEPAHMSRYMIISLVFFLFDKSNQMKKTSQSLINAVVVMIGIGLTTSGIGIIISAVVWGLWVAVWISSNRNKVSLNKIAIMVFLLILFVILSQTDVAQSVFYRVNNTDLTNVNTAGGARFRGYLQYFNLQFIYKIIGMGYGTTPNTALVTWFSGASYVLYGIGFIGFLVCIFIFVKIFLMVNNRTGRVLLVSWFLLFMMDDSFMSHVAVVYFSFVCFSDDKLNKGSEQYVDGAHKTQ